MLEEAVVIKHLAHIFLCLLVGFLLGIHDGHFALWKDTAAEPLQVFPYSVAMLPSADQQALRNGIHLSDELQLQQLLEDYLS